MDPSYSTRPGGLILALNPAETVLLVIDMQKGFIDPNGSYGKFSPHYADSIRKLVPTVRTAIDYCHESAVQVVFSRQIHVPEFFAAGLHAFMGREKTAFEEAGLKLCLQGTSDVEIVEELTPETRDVVIDKNKASVFFNTWLDNYLKYFKTRTLLITGCVTGYCVLHSVYDAWARDFDVIVVEDAVGDPDARIHDAILEQIDRRFGRVLKWNEVERALAAFPDSWVIDGTRP
jgi:ureidoacrylate peracid hydrolase